MKSSKKLVIDEERKLRNIADYIFDSTSRLIEHAELLTYISKNKEEFLDERSDEHSKGTITFIISLVDLYSRDAVMVLGNILDEDRKTSSLFTLMDHIQDIKKRKRYSNRLKSIKKALNSIVRIRGNHVAHFNTKLNIHENGHIQINGILQLDPRYIKRITKRIESFFWDIKEELSIEGLFMFYRGEPITKSFRRLIGK